MAATTFEKRAADRVVRLRKDRDREKEDLYDPHANETRGIRIMKGRKSGRLYVTRACKDGWVQAYESATARVRSKRSVRPIFSPVISRK